MIRALFSLLILSLSLTASPQAVVKDPLDMAQSLAKGLYKGYVYKTKGKAKSIDCTEFVLAVTNDLAKLCDKKLTSAQRSTLTIATVGADKLQDLVKTGDKKIRGVQTALIDAKIGVEVTVAKAKPGDMIQYWYKTKAGVWLGHAGVVESVQTSDDKTSLSIFGSHKTTLKSRADGETVTDEGGIGTGPSLVLPSSTIKPYLVRWTAKLKSKKK